MAKETAHVEDIQHEMVEFNPAQQTTGQKVEVVTLETTIKNEIKKFNIADAAIEELKKQYSGLTIAGIDDREGYKKVHAAWQVVRGKRIQVEKVHKVVKADYLAVSKAIDGEKNRLVGLLSPLETELGNELERIDKAIEEEKQKAERQAQERLQGRVAELLENGMSFNPSGYYSIGDTITMDVVTLKNFSDEDYGRLLDKVKAENQKIIDAKAEAERQEQERLEAIKRQQEEQEAERKRLEAERQEMERQRAEMRNQRTQLRVDVMKNAGFTHSMDHGGMLWANFPDAGTISVLVRDIAELEGEQWDAKFSELRKQLENLRQMQAEAEEAAKQRRQQAEREAQLRLELENRYTARATELARFFGHRLGVDSGGNFFIKFRTEGGDEFMQWSQVEVKTLTDDAWPGFIEGLRQSFDDLTSREAEYKKYLDQKAEAERQAAMSDVDRVKEFLNQLAAIKRPELKNKKINAAFSLFDQSVTNSIDILHKTLDAVK